MEHSHLEDFEGHLVTQAVTSDCQQGVSSTGSRSEFHSQPVAQLGVPGTGLGSMWFLPQRTGAGPGCQNSWVEALVSRDQTRIQGRSCNLVTRAESLSV